MRFLTDRIDVLGRRGRRVVDMRRSRSVPYAPASVFKRLFELYDITRTTVKVRGLSDLNNELASLLGVWAVIGAGTATLDTAITISTYSVIYINRKRSAGGGTATLEIATDTLANWQANGLPNGDHDDQTRPLWWIPWISADSRIDRVNITWLGDAPELPAFS